MIPADRALYNIGESLTVRCETGYRPSQARITCLNPQTGNEWDIIVQCIGQCKRPAVEGLIPVDREFYNVGESLTLRCEAGYRPLHDRTTCTSRQPNDVWDNPPFCIAQCRKPPVKGLISAHKEFYEVGESLPVQCTSGYQPSHERTYCVKPRTESEWDPSARCIGNNFQGYFPGQCKRPAGEGMILADREFYNVGESLVVQCGIGYRPSYERISCINGQADVEWDHSPQCIEQCEKPPDTDEYTTSGEKSFYDQGESITVRCRAGERPSQETITCVTLRRMGQWDHYPECINSTQGLEYFNLSLDLVSMLWIVVPIFTIKLLALVVLLIIQITLMEEGSKRKWIFYWKKREDELYDDAETAEPS